jgi:Arc/MetJ-type ribon-helix-helix transcriptional regulator
VAVQLKPETERLVQEEIENGHFRSADELIVQGVLALREKSRTEQPISVSRKPRKNLADILSEPPFAGSELNLERQKTTQGRSTCECLFDRHQCSIGILAKRRTGPKSQELVESCGSRFSLRKRVDPGGNPPGD